MVTYLIFIGMAAFFILIYIAEHVKQKKNKTRADVCLNVASIESCKILRIEQPFKKWVLCIYLPFILIGGAIALHDLGSLYEDIVGDKSLFCVFFGFALIWAIIIFVIPTLIIFRSFQRIGKIVLEKETLTITSLLKTRTIFLSEIRDLFVYHCIYHSKGGIQEVDSLIILLKTGTEIEKVLEKSNVEKCVELVQTVIRNDKNDVQVSATVNYE
ncbi:MAG TPA: hypothetical protein VF941_19135 [Clostridia bacterium]